MAARLGGSPFGFWRLARWLGVLVGVVAVYAVVDGWRAFGRRAVGERRARMERSQQWRGGQFVNPQPMVNSLWLTLKGTFAMSPDVSPKGPISVSKPDLKQLVTTPPSGLRVTWFGHSTTLVEIDGHRVLTDPIWSERASPLTWIGPQRWFLPPVALRDLPPIDAVVISHDHYDHLDYRTISAMKEWKTTFVVPLGMGAHLAYWGVPEARIVELDWWERTRVGALELVLTPTRHASGRMITDDAAKLWGGFAVIGKAHRVYYSGDTGLFPAMREIGERLGPFDLTMIEVGQYGSGWPDWHLGPEQAVLAHTMVKGGVLLPVHWGALALAFHGWTEPIERVLVAAKAAGVKVVAPRPGQSIEPTAGGAVERWWPDLPWSSAKETPMVSGGMGVEPAR